MQERETTETGKQSASPKNLYLRKKKPYQAPPSCPAKLYARIKRTSQHYHQGQNSNGKQITFPVESIQAGSHTFRLNHNNYELQDLAFFVKDTKGRFLKLS